MVLSVLMKNTQDTLDKSFESNRLEMRNHKMNHKIRKVDELKEQLASVSTDHALLCIIHRGGGTFIWDGLMWNADSAREKWDACLLEMSCSEFGVIRFFGGPPGAGKWHDGTILSMLCDLILFDENTREWSAEAKLSA